MAFVLRRLLVCPRLFSGSAGWRPQRPDPLEAEVAGELVIRQEREVCALFGSLIPAPPYSAFRRTGFVGERVVLVDRAFMVACTNSVSGTQRRNIDPRVFKLLLRGCQVLAATNATWM